MNKPTIIRLTSENPTLVRLHEQALKYAELCAQIMLTTPGSAPHAQKAYDAGYALMAKRYGLRGKYVGHDGAKQRGGS